MAANPDASRAPERWKRALGRFIDTRGFTMDEWQQAAMGTEQASVILAVQHVLDCLRLQANQGDLLERETLAENWQPWFHQQFGEAAAVVLQANPVDIAFALRWCELVLERRLDPAQVLEEPPEAVIQWTRDLS